MTLINKDTITEFWRRYRADLAIIVLFIVIAWAYFLPADLDGRILYRHDSSAGRGAGQEQQEYYARTGERTRWTNALFSGMPTYQLAPSYDSTDALGAVAKVYHLWLPENVWYVFVYLLGFYILLRAFDVRKELAVLGSIIWAFSSYFFIIIAAGHIWKVMALAYLPPMIAGIVYAYRGRYLRGLLLTTIFAAFEIQANHIQMTYYYLLIILLLVLAFLVVAIRAKQVRHFFKATGICVVAAILAIGINLSTIYHTWQYGQESMRGAAELKSNSTNSTSTGLDRDYITQWSYGLGETWTLLVPNAKGGATVPLTHSERAMSKADPQLAQLYTYFYQYWGDQPGTSGPVYVGAFVVMLFILSLFLVRGPIKWALLIATILSILLAWGRNFMPFTNFFLDYIPMYSKFRTVASILVIAEFCIPLLAVLALKEIIAKPTLLYDKAQYVVISFLLTAGVCVLFAIFPTHFFTFLSEAERDMLTSSLEPQYVAAVTNNLTEMRTAVFSADCWRSVIIIIIGSVMLYLFVAKKFSAKVTIWLVAALCLIDMWSVNKRYLNDDMFVARSVRDTAQPMTDTDRLILADDDADYRVLNLATNTFNENETSFYHKSIGGYHAAKLQRYQDMIDHYITPEMCELMPAIYDAQGDLTDVNMDSICPVLNALNMRYVIVPVQQGQTLPIYNPHAFGNAWLVDSIAYTQTANEEIDKLGSLALRHEAVADITFYNVLGTATTPDSTDIVTLTSYEPNELHYSVTTNNGGIVLFSEVYYPGWTATIDGKKTPIARADYLLRALSVPAGNHDIVLTFKPTSLVVTETIAYTSYLALIVLLIIAGTIYYRRQRKSKA